MWKSLENVLILPTQLPGYAPVCKGGTAPLTKN